MVLRYRSKSRHNQARRKSTAHHPDMLNHFVNLLGHSWHAMVAGTSTNTLGFVLWTLALAAVGWASTVAAKWRGLKRQKASSPLRTALSDSLWPGIIFSAGATYGLVIVVFAAFMVRTIYRDHQDLVGAMEEIRTEKREVEGELELRRHIIPTTDPLFGNINQLLMAFDMYRHERHGVPCVIWLSEPPESTTSLASEVAQFSNSVSDCFTFGPFPGGGNPDLDKEALDGMVSDSVIVHITRGDKAEFTLFNNLSNLMKTKLSYDFPPRIRSHYALPSQFAGKERVIWLQFGMEVKWNSQRTEHIAKNTPKAR